MKLVSENDILNKDFRNAIIQEIEGSENINRKREHMKRRDLFKDRTRRYVQKALESHGLKKDTVALMMARAGNVSFLRKVINKLARTYKGGVTRVIDGVDSSITDEISSLLDYDQKKKKVDKYLELHKNVMTLMLPKEDSATGKWKITKTVLAPWQYDVIHDANDKEQERVLILSDFNKVPSYGDGKDAAIADAPSDAGRGDDKTYIWWSDTYHFTTDSEGKIVEAPEGNLNPIGEMPACNYAINQDGEFWAQGGEDLVDGSVLINVLLTDMFSIAYQQGWGQLVITGNNIDDKQINLGPHQALVLNHTEDDPTPTVTVVNSNPPLEMWMKSIEQYVALLLSTNSLSLNTVATKLDAANFPSGIAMLIEMSEATNDIEDKQKLFVECERKEFRIYTKWHNLYQSRDLLAPEFNILGTLPDGAKLSVLFNEVKPVISEDQKIKNLQARKALGLNDDIELIKLDNPGITDDMAEEKLVRIRAGKLGGILKANEAEQARKNGVSNGHAEL